MRDRVVPPLVPMIRAAVSGLVAAAVLATPATAQARTSKGAEPLKRREVIKRAKRWAKAKVEYNQAGHVAGYRTDCSGFVSYAWDLPDNLVTWQIPKVARQIRKDQLKAGDVLLNAKGGPRTRHVVIFEKWAKRDKSAYWGIEQTGQNGVDRTIRRVVPYPYRVNKRAYAPYRYVGLSKYWRTIKASERQPVKGYKGRNPVPAWKKATAKATPKRPRAGAPTRPLKRERAASPQAHPQAPVAPKRRSAARPLSPPVALFSPLTGVLQPDPPVRREEGAKTKAAPGFLVRVLRVLGLA